MKTAVLIATIGTRDLMFQTSTGNWYNLGDDRIRESEEIISEQLEIVSDLGLENQTYRKLTKYLLENRQQYIERIQPVILGGIFRDRAADIGKIYLVGTNQDESISEREKDTIYACELLKVWLTFHYPRLQDKVNIILFEEPDINPSNFEQMFRWWRKVWQEKIKIPQDKQIWVCLKGGVGQSSEACRISGLSLRGEQVQFFEFKPNLKNNYQGLPSDYSGPFLGKNYLWDRKRQEVKVLLDRHDYEAALNALKPYFKPESSETERVQYLKETNALLKAAVQWNRGNFQRFVDQLKNTAISVDRAEQWWWTAYEAGYLAMVRLWQGNTVEAMFHSFRAVEGLMLEWAIAHYPEDIYRKRSSADTIFDDVVVNCSIAKHPELQQYADWFNGKNSIVLYGKHLESLFRSSNSHKQGSLAFDWFCEYTRKWRNYLFHRLVGLEKGEVFQAWKTGNQEQWEAQVVNCLNYISGQEFTSLAEASLMHEVGKRLQDALNSYEP